MKKILTSFMNLSTGEGSRIAYTYSEVDESTGSIKAVIDLTGKTAGEYTLPVTITLPEGYEQVEEVQATVQLNQAEKTSE